MSKENSVSNIKTCGKLKQVCISLKGLENLTCEYII